MALMTAPVSSALSGALKIIEDAIAGEAEDKMFYEYLIKIAPSMEDRDIIKGIRENELHHATLFRQLYTKLTGKPPAVQQDLTFERPKTYCEGLKNALMGEQNAVRKYRNILFALTDRADINTMTEIITDEIRHGILYSYLYAKNACKV